MGEEKGKKTSKKTPKTHFPTQGFKDFDRQRKYLGPIYIFGCFDHQTLGQINSRTEKDCYYVTHLMQDVFWGDYEDDPTATGKGRKKRTSIPRKYVQRGQSRLPDAYTMYSMDKKPDILLNLSILQTLRKGDANGQQLKKPADFLPVTGAATYQNILNHARALAHHGHITCQKHASRDEYIFHLKQNILSVLKPQQLWELYTYVCFASGVTYPRVPGSFLRRTLERELMRRAMTIPDSVPFVLRHNCNLNIVDEEAVFRLLHIIENKQAVQITHINKKGDTTTTREVEYLPVKLRVDRRLGRWYVLMASEYKGQLKPSVLPVSNLEAPDLYIAGSDPRWEQANEVVKNAFHLSLFSGKVASQSTLVEAELHFGTEKGRENQFLRETRAGQIEYRDGKPYYCALINDPLELLPLLRSYSPWLTILPGDHDLDKRLREDLRQMQDHLDGRHWAPSQLTDVNLTKKAVKVANGTTDNDEALQAQKQKLMSPFQSRLMQFCLDLLTCAANSHPPTEETITSLSKKYGIYVPQDIIRLLQTSEFLEPGNEPVLFHTHHDPPTLPMSQIEQEYLQYILSEEHVPEVSLFLSEDTKQALENPCSQCPKREKCENREECDIRSQGELLKQPPGWAKHIEPLSARGMSLPKDFNTEGFRLLLQAIRERKLIRYKYRISRKSGLQHGECLPWKLEYSAYDKRWWIILYHLEDKRTIKTPLYHLTDIKLGDPVYRDTLPDSQIDAAIEQLHMDEPVELQIRNEHNALLRCFTVFENQEVCESSHPAKEGFRLSFRGYRFDTEEILRQLMYLGPNVSLTGHKALCEALRQRLNDAQKNNPEPAEDTN